MDGVEVICFITRNVIYSLVNGGVDNTSAAWA